MKIRHLFNEKIKIVNSRIAVVYEPCILCGMTWYEFGKVSHKHTWVPASWGEKRNPAPEFVHCIDVIKIKCPRQKEKLEL